MSESKLDLLTAASKAEIDQWVAKYPADKKQSATMPALRIVQDQNEGYLTQDLMDAIAEYLGIPAISVYEVATFYSMYEHKPVGKHKICVCTNVSCMLRGSDEIVAHLKKKINVNGWREVSADGRFSLKEVECLGACAGAPMMQIGREYHENLTPEKIDKILESLD
ncbi:MAG: NADH-quinone oxidoreductase subunit NuoE [Gammaproteobacteria bacterium]|nr:NADH-quinone oxidoreductase subunit NuoE [Gammaproteobacteria bacterium]